MLKYSIAARNAPSLKWRELRKPFYYESNFELNLFIMNEADSISNKLYYFSRLSYILVQYPLIWGPAHKRSSVWFIIRRKTVNTIIFLRIWMESEVCSVNAEDWQRLLHQIYNSITLLLSVITIQIWLNRNQKSIHHRHLLQADGCFTKFRF